ncbi:hypothetical protein UFOVP169_45 [uncultured Caudovirales phage]|uniref:Uncharacterized protein n=1 Tax=uncultured Caudovirales phage TaxID=2100421 RepID=A0A6J7WBH7_9CAUD|nr:hypothetical protein UFOVP169_45 [uncultured Caudovirales phage]
MPIDPNIALQYRAPQIDFSQIQQPVNQMAQVYQLQQAKQQNQLGQMQMAEYERAKESKNQLRNLFANPEIDRTSPDFLRQIYAISPEQGMEIEKNLREAEAKKVERQLHEAQIGEIGAKTKDLERKAKEEQYNNSIKHIVSFDTRDQIIADINAQARAGNLPMMQATQLIQSIPTDPAAISQWQMKTLRGILSAKDQLELDKPMAVGGSLLSREGKVIATAPMTDYQKRELDIRGGELKVKQQRLSEELATGKALTPDTLDFAAQMYVQTGQMPQVGMGKNAQAIRSQILERGAQLAMGGGAKASDAAGNVIGNKIDVSTRTKANKDFSTGTQGKQVTAFNTAIDHLSTMDKLSDALQNNDIKAFNSLGNIIAKQTGQPAPTNFDAAKQIVTSEVIKAVVASGGGVTERQEAERNFASASSPAQLKGVIQTYKKLLGGQLKSLNLQYENTTGKKDFESKLTPDAKAELKSVTAQTAPANTNIDKLLDKYK